MTVQFDGTYLAWVAKKANVYGKAWVTLDGGVPQLVDLYSATTGWKQTVWTTGVLPAGVHTVTIARAGLKSPAAYDYNISVDTFDVVGTLAAAPPPYASPARYQNNNAKMVYTGTWSTRWASTASGGTFYYINAAGTVTVKFTGTYLSWVARKGPGYGIADVSLDGGPVTSIDLYSATTLDEQNVYNTGMLPNATHTLVIQWTNTKNPASYSFVIDMDAVDVIGTLIL